MYEKLTILNNDKSVSEIQGDSAFIDFALAIAQNSPFYNSHTRTELEISF